MEAETVVEEELAEADEELNAWASLQKAIDDAAEGEVIVLSDDVISEESDSALSIASGKNVTIDLAGHTISRTLSEAVEEGCVFVVEGTLKLINSGAQIDGVITGGKITGNTCTGGEAIDTVSGILHVSGSAVISGNYRGNLERNVFVYRNKIQVTGPLADSARIGATGSNIGDGLVITEGLKGNGTASRFTSDNDKYAVKLNDDGEAVIGQFDDVPVFSGHQLILSGSLGMQFGVKFPDGFDCNGSYMTFTVNDSEQKVYTDPDQVKKDGKGKYTCYVNTLQMAEEIHAVFHYGDSQTIDQVYKVTDYLSYFDNPKEEFSDETKALIKAIADYGYYAHPYLIKLHKLGNKYAVMDKHYTDSYDYDPISDAVASYAFVKAVDGTKLEKVSYKLSLDSDTALSVRMVPEEGTEVSASAEFHGNTYTAEKQEDGSYIIKITGIKASWLGDPIEVKGSAGGSFTVKVSALAYVRSIFSSEKSTKLAKDAVSALYTYYQAVKKCEAAS